MSSKLGAIFSLLYIFIAFMFGVDLVMMQLTYTNLDSLSINASYLISKNGYITQEIKDSFWSKYGVRIYAMSYNSADSSYKDGDEYGYVLEKRYSPVVISTSDIKIKLNRYTIINFYN